MSVTISPGRPEFHDLVTGRWLSVVSTSEPGDEPAIFFTVLYNSLELLYSKVS